MEPIRYYHDPNIRFRDGTAFIGFPGPGMVGTMAVDILSQLLDLKEIGRIRIPGLQPLIYFEEGVMNHPTLILGSTERNVAIIMLGTEIPESSWFPVADFLVAWAKTVGIKNIATLVSQLGEESPESSAPPATIEFVAEKENLERLLETGVAPMPTGSVSGFHGAVLDSSLMDEGIDASVFIVTTTEDELNPDLAVSLVEILMTAFALRLPDDWKETITRYTSTLHSILESEKT